MKGATILNFLFRQVSFEDVIAEPVSVRSGDRVWIWSHALFEVSRVWFYRIITAVLAVPVSLIAGILFAVLSFIHIWYEQITFMLLTKASTAFKPMNLSLLGEECTLWNTFGLSCQNLQHNLLCITFYSVSGSLRHVCRLS